MSEIMNLEDYNIFLIEIKKDIQSYQQRAVNIVNTQMTILYYKIGQMIDTKQLKQGWGTKVIKRLSIDIKNELPQIKGFSERNITRMLKFYKEYKILSTIVPQHVAQNSNLIIESYELTEVLPSEFKSALPTIDMIEEEMENIILKKDTKK